MIKLAKRINTDSNFKVLDIRHASEIEGCYDAVIAAFCIPYLSFKDLDVFFKNMWKLTAKNGIVYLSCMEGTREKSGLERTTFTGDSEMYINYYPRHIVESLMEKYGFRIKKIYTKEYHELDCSITTELIYIAEPTLLASGNE